MEPEPGKRGQSPPPRGTDSPGPHSRPAVQVLSCPRAWLKKSGCGKVCGQASPRMTWRACVSLSWTLGHLRGQPLFQVLAGCCFSEGHPHAHSLKSSPAVVGGGRRSQAGSEAPRCTQSCCPRKLPVVALGPGTGAPPRPGEAGDTGPAQALLLWWTRRPEQGEDREVGERQRPEADRANWTHWPARPARPVPSVRTPLGIPERLCPERRHVLPATTGTDEPAGTQCCRKKHAGGAWAPFTGTAASGGHGTIQNLFLHL